MPLAAHTSGLIGDRSPADLFRVVDLGRMSYDAALERQHAEHARVLGDRDDPATPPGTILLVEHDPPVITVSRRPAASQHLLADEAQLAAMGVEVRPTDRGGDITYHGPGQLVAYPIVDLQRLGLRIHAYIRTLERTVIDVCTGLGLDAHQDETATGVWLGLEENRPRKIAAIGVRVKRWVTQHGLAFNVDPDLDHFRLIVPCGISDRAVTSLARELGTVEGGMPRVKELLAALLTRSLAPARPSASEGRALSAQRR